LILRDPVDDSILQEAGGLSGHSGGVSQPFFGQNPALRIPQPDTLQPSVHRGFGISLRCWKRILVLFDVRHKKARKIHLLFKGKSDILIPKLKKVFSYSVL